MKNSKRLTLAGLAGESGIPARTIRFYIARGLLAAPDKAGRGAAYSEAHLERLAEIQRLQGRGLTLLEIGRALAGAAKGAIAPAAPWWQYSIASDVQVLVRADAAPWRLRQIREALNNLAARLEGPGGLDKEGRNHGNRRNN